jgi:hypothetical protein
MEALAGRAVGNTAKIERIATKLARKNLFPRLTRAPSSVKLPVCLGQVQAVRSAIKGTSWNSIFEN